MSVTTTTAGSASALDIARDYLHRGYAPLPLGYREKGIYREGWQDWRLTEADLPGEFSGRKNVGVLTGEPSGWLIDVDLDHELAVELADEFLPATRSEFGRAGKQRSHRLYVVNAPIGTHKRETPKDGDGKKKMIVELRSTGLQTVFPGSVHECGEPIEWVVDEEPTVIDPAELKAAVDALANEVLRRLGYSEQPRRRPAAHNGQQRTTHGDIANRVRKYLATIPPAVDGFGGHDQTYYVACRLVLGFALTPDQAYPFMVEYSERCQPPWSEKEIRHKLDDANKESGERGFILNGDSLADRHPSFAAGAPAQCDDASKPTNDGDSATQQPAIRNFKLDSTEGDDGKAKWVATPVSMSACIERVQFATGNALMRVDGGLFVHDKVGKPGAVEVDWLLKPAAMFGFLASRASVDWRGGQGFVGREEFHAELNRTAPKFDAVEVLPHEPRLPGHYYACNDIGPGDGEFLERLLDRFNPAEPIDRDLILAALMTPFWGGRGGSRPCIVVTSDDGRGIGKSKLVEMIGMVAGGTVDFSTNDDFGRMKSRLLSADALTKRVALVDNIKSLRLSWAEFEGLVTAPFISGWRNYVGEATRPNVILWCLTMNGASMSCDMAQRSVPIKLKRPQRSASWEEETVRLIVDHRDEIIRDIIGRLRQEPFQFAKFSRWASWERDVLSRVDDPAEAQRVIAERQGEFDVEDEEASIIEDFVAEQLGRLDYRADTDTVFLPADVMCRWFNLATGEKKATVAVSRTLNQMTNEGKLKHIVRSDGRTNGRGFVWVGGDTRTAMAVDITQRISNLYQEKTRSESVF
jgi:hypothetical protein